MAPDPNRPSPIPSLVPFVTIAAIVVVIFLGVMLFPTIKGYINQQDCIATGRSDCVAR
jgi:hypothetical protein